MSRTEICQEPITCLTGTSHCTPKKGGRRIVPCHRVLKVRTAKPDLRACLPYFFPVFFRFQALLELQNATCKKQALERAQYYVDKCVSFLARLLTHVVSRRVSTRPYSLKGDIWDANWIDRPVVMPPGIRLHRSRIEIRAGVTQRYPHRADI